MLKPKTLKLIMQEIAMIALHTLSLNLERAKYSAKVGFIIYDMVETRVNIAFDISMVSQFAKNPSSKYFNTI